MHLLLSRTFLWLLFLMSTSRDSGFICLYTLKARLTDWPNLQLLDSIFFSSRWLFKRFCRTHEMGSQHYVEGERGRKKKKKPGVNIAKNKHGIVPTSHSTTTLFSNVLYGFCSLFFFSLISLKKTFIVKLCGERVLALYGAESVPLASLHKSISMFGRHFSAESKSIWIEVLSEGPGGISCILTCPTPYSRIASHDSIANDITWSSCCVA